MFKYLFLSCLLLITTLVRAQELHLNIESEAQKVLLPGANALSLDQVKRMVVNEELDIQISYERLIEAQRKIGVARAAYFPYGLGTVAAMYFLNVWNPLILVELLTSLPSKVYNVQAEKNMALAQKYSLAALRENVKNQVAHLYYGILKEEAALKITRLRIALIESLIQVYRDRVDMGLSTQDEVFDLERGLLRDRDTYLKFSAYLTEAKVAFNVMLGNSPEQGGRIELRPVGNFLEEREFHREMQELVEMALRRSNEIVSADYMITAARKSKKSAKWSILSFSGIGFGYYARIQVAGSKISAAELNRKIVEETLINQVYSSDHAFKKALEMVTSEREILSDTVFYLRSQLARFQEGQLTLDKLLETELTYLKDFNEMIQSHYVSLIKLEDEERVVMGPTGEISVPPGNFDVELQQNGNWYELSVRASEAKIVKVRYLFDAALGLRPMTSWASTHGFPVALKLYSPEAVNGTVEITLENGEVLTKHFNFKQ